MCRFAWMLVIQVFPIHSIVVSVFVLHVVFICVFRFASRPVVPKGLSIFQHSPILRADVLPLQIDAQ